MLPKLTFLVEIFRQITVRDVALPKLYLLRFYGCSHCKPVLHTILKDRQTRLEKWTQRMLLRVSAFLEYLICVNLVLGIQSDLRPSRLRDRNRSLNIGYFKLDQVVISENKTEWFWI